MLVSKRLEWDMGHRILNHNSECRNLHGHRYAAEIRFEGELVKDRSASSNGMVIDFGDIKKIAKDNVIDAIDHSFMYWEGDSVLSEFYEANPDMKSLAVSFTPTAENIAKWIFEQLEPLYVDKYRTGLKLHSIKLSETPTGYAVYQKENSNE